MSDEQKQQMIEMMYGRSRGSFAGISEVDVDGMLQLQEERGAVIVDVRSPAEQAVSMIPGAITSADFEASRSDYDDKPIVCYCTIGHRSGMYTRRLQAEGLDAYNLKGAILAYSHSGRDLETAGGPTRAVHVYNAQAGQLLADGYEPVW